MIIGILPYPRANRNLLLVPLLACFFSPAQAKRKDVVIMNNGDHFAGQVKRLQTVCCTLRPTMCPGISVWIGVKFNRSRVRRRPRKAKPGTKGLTPRHILKECRKGELAPTEFVLVE